MTLRDGGSSAFVGYVLATRQLADGRNPVPWRDDITRWHCRQCDDITSDDIIVLHVHEELPELRSNRHPPMATRQGLATLVFAQIRNCLCISAMWWHHFCHTPAMTLPLLVSPSPADFQEGPVPSLWRYHRPRIVAWGLLLRSINWCLRVCFMYTNHPFLLPQLR